jgi:hypothetical protein
MPYAEIDMEQYLIAVLAGVTVVLITRWLFKE